MIATSVVQYKLASAHTHTLAHTHRYIYTLTYMIISYIHICSIFHSLTHSPAIHPDGPRKSAGTIWSPGARCISCDAWCPWAICSLAVSGKPWALMGKPWETNGKLMGNQWLSNGFPMVSPSISENVGKATAKIPCLNHHWSDSYSPFISRHGAGGVQASTLGICITNQTGSRRSLVILPCSRLPSGK